MSDAPVQVYAAKNSIEATLLVQLLAEEGISARIASNAVEAVAGEVPWQLATVPIWVKSADAERAQAVIRERKP